MDENQVAEKEEYDEKLKEVEGVCNPIVSKIYQDAGMGGDMGGDDDEDIDHDEL